MKPFPSYIQKIIDNDFYQIKTTPHLSKMAEKRKYQQDAIFPGFFGIHYACYYKSEQILENLMVKQATKMTKFGFFTRSFTISGYQVTGRLDPLSVCVYSDFLEGAEMIINYIQVNNIQYKSKRSLIDACLYVRNSTSIYVLSCEFMCLYKSQRKESYEARRFLSS